MLVILSAGKIASFLLLVHELNTRLIYAIANFSVLNTNENFQHCMMCTDEEFKILRKCFILLFILHLSLVILSNWVSINHFSNMISASVLCIYLSVCLSACVCVCVCACVCNVYGRHNFSPKPVMQSLQQPSLSPLTAYLPVCCLPHRPTCSSHQLTASPPQTFS